MAIITNGKGGKTITHNVANATYVVVGNNSVSNIATPDEQVNGCTIRNVIWGCSSGSWAVKRGANTVMVLNNSGNMPFYQFGCPVNLDRTANVVIELSGGGTGFIMLELQKESVI